MESFDPWSDNSTGSPFDWVTWVRQWIARIVASADRFDAAPPLVSCARAGDMDGMRRWLNGDLDVTDDRGSTPLMLAAERGSLEMVRALLDAGARVDAAQVSWDGLRGKKVPVGTALTHAVKARRRDVVEELLARGANCDWRDARGLTPLMEAVSRPHDVELARSLLAKGADVNCVTRTSGSWECSALSCALPDVECVRLLLDGGANPNLPEAFPALPWALSRTHAWQNPANRPQIEPVPVAVVRLLLDAGAKVDGVTREVSKSTPLHWAALLDDPAYASLLLERGASVAARNRAGRTPLEEARARKNRCEAVEAVLVAAQEAGRR